MSSSTLDLPIEQAPRTGKGHGTSALGPSDSSDSGSDLQGAGDDGGEPGGVITPTGRSIGDADIDATPIRTAPAKCARPAVTPRWRMRPTSASTA
jgi:hypothetical protein